MAQQTISGQGSKSQVRACDLAELEQKGVAFHADTMDSGVCHMAYFADPDGNALMLHHRYAPAHARPSGNTSS